jgi:hypothetical protein
MKFHRRFILLPPSVVIGLSLEDMIDIAKLFSQQRYDSIVYAIITWAK